MKLKVTESQIDWVIQIDVVKKFTEVGGWWNPPLPSPLQIGLM